MSSHALADDRKQAAPPLTTPIGLEAYGDLPLTVKNMRRTIEMIAEAQLKLKPYEKPTKLADGVTAWHEITPECDTEEVQSFNRGYQLALVGSTLMKHATPGALLASMLAAGRGACAQRRSHG